MDPVVAILLYGFSFIAGLVVLSLAGQVKMFQSLFFRVLAGGSAGGLTSWYLVGISPFLSWLEYSVNGKLGVGGYVFALSLGVLISVWSWNLINHQGAIIR